MNQMNQESNLEFGDRNELIVLKIIRKYFNDDIKKEQDRYEIFDFQGTNTRYELKSRRCNSWTYRDTMIGLNKLDAVNGNFIFLFQFYDGLFYVKYDKEQFDTFRRDRGYKDYLFIPKERLIKILTR